MEQCIFLNKDAGVVGNGRKKVKATSPLDNLSITKISAEIACSNLFFLRSDLLDPSECSLESYRQLKTFTDGFIIIGKPNTIYPGLKY